MRCPYHHKIFRLRACYFPCNPSIMINYLFYHIMNSAVSRKYRLVSKMKTLMLLVYVVTKNFNYEFFKTNDSSRLLLNLRSRIISNSAFIFRRYQQDNTIALLVLCVFHQSACKILTIYNKNVEKSKLQNLNIRKKKSKKPAINTPPLTNVIIIFCFVYLVRQVVGQLLPELPNLQKDKE